MILICLADCAVVLGSAEYVFENIGGSPNIYEAEDSVGKAAVATKKCAEVVVDDDHPYKGPTPELPIVHPLPAATPLAATATEPVAGAAMKPRRKSTTES